MKKKVKNAKVTTKVSKPGTEKKVLSPVEKTTNQKKTPLFIERDLVVQAIFDSNEETLSE